MTKKHFEAIAKQIANIKNYDKRISAARAVALALQEMNPRFDHAHFYAACDCNEDGK